MRTVIRKSRKPTRTRWRPFRSRVCHQRHVSQMTKHLRDRVVPKRRFSRFQGAFEEVLTTARSTDTTYEGWSLRNRPSG